MDICKVYIVDSMCPSNFMISAEGELFKLLYQDYHGVFSHIPFVHQEYTDYWERGIPVIHVTNDFKERNGHVDMIPGKNLTVFLPNSVSRENASELLKQLDDITASFDGESYYTNLIYVKDRLKYGYDYECYPSQCTQGPKFPFQEAVKLFLRDSFHELSQEEAKMFDEARTFNMKTLLSSDDSLYRYPVNHNYCGVMIVNGEGESYASTVLKTGHQEVLNHMLLEMTGKDVGEEEKSLMKEVTNLSVAVLFFREGDVFSYIPEKVNELQYHELSEVIDRIDIFSDEYTNVFSARVLSNGNLEGEEESFRENISISYAKFKDDGKSRGTI